VNINKKILIILVSCFLFISSVFILNSVGNIRRSQANGLKLFKEEFLELARESFRNNSNLFFSNLDAEIKLADKNEDKSQFILHFLDKIDPLAQSVVVVDIKNKNFIEKYSNQSLVNVFDDIKMQSLISGYLNENFLNKKTDFDLDNFNEFSADNKNEIIPKKIHFRVYDDAGLMVGVGQDFLSVKVRLGFISRQNETLLNNQLYSSIAIFSASLMLTILFLVFFMRKIILKPLKKISGAVKLITGGDLNKKIEIDSQDEIGQLGIAFNEMSSKLKKSYGELELKITERTKELEEERGSLGKKVEERTIELEGLKKGLEKTVEERTKKLNDKLAELEKMNDLMVGRELKMLKLKEEVEELKSKNK